MEFNVWTAIEWIDKFVSLTYPFFILAFSVGYTIKQKSTVSAIMLSGALLLSASAALRSFIPHVDSIVLHALQPTNDTNPLIWFIYLKGGNLGLFLVAASLCVCTFKSKNV